MASELGIGQVGLGPITGAMRKGYGLYGQRLVAACDPDPAARQRVLGDIPDLAVYAGLDELLTDPAVEVVDLATRHHRETRLPLLEKILAAGKPVLVQKPLAINYAEALEVVELFERMHGTGMVNQNMCFAPTALAFERAIMVDRILGRPSYAQLQLQYLFDNHRWGGRDARWWTIGLTVHHLGLLQLLFGPPETVFALTGRDESQPGVTADGYGHIALIYPDGLQVLVVSTGTYYGANLIEHGNEVMWVQGADGLLDWQPNGDLVLSTRASGGTLKIRQTELNRETLASAGDRRWFPHAFGLAMAHFQQALAHGREPFCSVGDNLYVIAVAEAAYRSGAERRAVNLEEIMGERYDRTYGTGWSHGFSGWQPPSPSPELEKASA